MKKLAVIFFCCFFLISGRILLSIGMDVVSKRVDTDDLMSSIDASILFAQQTKPNEETTENPLKSDGWKKNPFRRLTTGGGTESASENGAESQTAQPLDLKAISFGGGRAFAVINGRVLTVGERIDGYRIEAIRWTEIELIKDGQTTKLILWDKPWEEDQ